jgi:putative membrane protein insertion efficiency factor
MMRTLLIRLVQGYRLLLSPWLGSACRFEPTCSAYALQALQSHGAMIGGCLTLRRLARCHPWCPGGHDPVPQQRPRLFACLTLSTEVSAPGPRDPNRSGT